MRIIPGAGLEGGGDVASQSREVRIADNGVTLAKVQKSVVGDRWGIVATVANDGVMEIGLALDFHNSDASAVDFARRLESFTDANGFCEQSPGGIIKRVVTAIRSTLVQGDILYYDGTNFVRLAPGTANQQFLRTQGTGAAPQWASPGLTLLNSGSVVNAATIDIVLTSFTAYRALKFMFYGLLPVTDSVDLWLRLSTDGGASYIAAGYNYAGHGPIDNGDAAQGVGASAQAQILLNRNAATNHQSNVAGHGTNIEVTMMNQASTGFFPRLHWIGSMFSDGDFGTFLHGQGMIEATHDVDALRVMFSSGNIASGSWALYGYA
jgi:hypothetical protein